MPNNGTRCDDCGAHMSEPHAERCPQTCIGLDRGTLVLSAVPFGRCTYGGCDLAHEVYVIDCSRLNSNRVVYPLCRTHAVDLCERGQLPSHEFTRCHCARCALVPADVCLRETHTPVWNYERGACGFATSEQSYCGAAVTVYTLLDGTTVRGWCDAHAAHMVEQFPSRHLRCYCARCTPDTPSTWRRPAASPAPVPEPIDVWGYNEGDCADCLNEPATCTLPVENFERLNLCAWCFHCRNNAPEDWGCRCDDSLSRCNPCERERERIERPAPARTPRRKRSRDMGIVVWA